MVARAFPRETETVQAHLDSLPSRSRTLQRSPEVNEQVGYLPHYRTFALPRNQVQCNRSNSPVRFVWASIVLRDWRYALATLIRRTPRLHCRPPGRHIPDPWNPDSIWARRLDWLGPRHRRCHGGHRLILNRVRVVAPWRQIDHPGAHDC